MQADIDFYKSQVQNLVAHNTELQKQLDEERKSKFKQNICRNCGHSDIEEEEKSLFNPNQNLEYNSGDMFIDPPYERSYTPSRLSSPARSGILLFLGLLIFGVLTFMGSDPTNAQAPGSNVLM